MNRRILFVDDERELCDLFAFEFQFAGAIVEKAYSGNSAKKLIETSARFDAVISDIRMPDGNGMDLLKFIKSHPEKNCPVFLVTGFSDLSMDEVKKAGASAVFQKPCALEDVVEAVAKALA